MTSYTPRLDLPFIEAAQAQKHVTHNAALERLDVMVQLRVQRFDATAPAASPVNGQSWALGDTPTGVWAGQGGKIATYAGDGWLFIAPGPGWRAWGLAEGELRVWGGAAWNPIGLTPATLNNLPSVGVGATADSTNRLTVSAPATLFNHAGAGHQIKVNKATETDTASLLYQTNFSGRAEMGLAGNADFSLKVSADGSAWTEALRIEGASGAVSLPATRSRVLIPYNYRHYLYENRRWTAPTNNAASNNASADLGTLTEPAIDWTCKGVYVPAGALLRGFTVAGEIRGSDIQGMDINIYFQHGPWNGAWNSAAATSRIALLTTSLTGTTGMHRIRHALNYTTPANGYVFLATRAAGTNTIGSVQYFDCGGSVDMLCPLNPV